MRLHVLHFYVQVVCFTLPLHETQVAGPAVPCRHMCRGSALKIFATNDQETQNNSYSAERLDTALTAVSHEKVSVRCCIEGGSVAHLLPVLFLW